MIEFIVGYLVGNSTTSSKTSENDTCHGCGILIFFGLVALVGFLIYIMQYEREIINLYFSYINAIYGTDYNYNTAFIINSSVDISGMDELRSSINLVVSKLVLVISLVFSLLFSIWNYVSSIITIYQQDDLTNIKKLSGVTLFFILFIILIPTLIDFGMRLSGSY